MVKKMETKPRITPVLRILDVDKAKEFYIGWLGFALDWEHRFGENFPLYCQVSRDGIVFHLTEHYGDCLPGASFRVRTRDLEAFHDEIAAKDYRYYKPCIEEKEWGSTEMSLLDPFGNRIIFVDDPQS